ncbi:MAG: adenylate kinase family protein [Planctomycetaceae bacterium]
MLDQRHTAVLLFGPPGVGKGTQGGLIGNIPGFRHVSTGEMFRSMDPTTPLGKKVRSFTRDGNFVPDALTIQIFRAFIEDDINSGRFHPQDEILLLDGIPRNAQQVEFIAADMDVRLVVHLVCRDEEKMIRRIRDRAAREHRVDDAREEVVRHRFEVYRQQSAPVLNCYPPDMIVDVPADGSPAEVMRDLLNKMIPIQNAHLQNNTTS